MSRRTNIYIDGFNLYFGCLKKTPYKWLDIAALCSRILNTSNSIAAYRYFTALVESRTQNPHQRHRQETYIHALETIPDLSVHYGRFLSHPVRMPLANPEPGAPNTVEVIKTEEKGSDVNLATHLLNDGIRGRYDVGVVISNDSDLLEPIKIVRRELGLTVGILNPQQRPSRVLSKEADFFKQIRSGPLKASQFPEIIHDKAGEIHKPAEW